MYDSNAERVTVKRVDRTGTGNVEVCVGENRRIWFTPEEARLVLEGLRKMLDERA